MPPEIDSIVIFPGIFYNDEPWAQAYLRASQILRVWHRQYEGICDLQDPFL